MAGEGNHLVQRNEHDLNGDGNVSLMERIKSFLGAKQQNPEQQAVQADSRDKNGDGNIGVTEHIGAAGGTVGGKFNDITHGIADMARSVTGNIHVHMRDMGGHACHHARSVGSHISGALNIRIGR